MIVKVVYECHKEVNGLEMTIQDIKTMVSMVSSDIFVNTVPIKCDFMAL